MFDKIVAVLREWIIVIAGLVLVIPLLYFASLPSQQPQQPSATASAPAGNNASSDQAAATPPSVPPALAQQAKVPAPTRPQPAQQASAAGDHQHGAVPQPQASNAAAPAARPPAPAQQAQTAQATSGQSPQQNAAAAPTNIKGDVIAGRQVFRKCQACHSLTPGKNLVGPSLAEVLGRKAGSLPNYNYSTAMKNADIVWNEKTLDAYLADPQKFVPGNKMPFPGLKTDHDRTDIIAYLAASGGAAPAQAAQAGQTAQPAAGGQAVQPQGQTGQAPAVAPPAPAAQAAPQQTARGAPLYIPDARYTLRSGIAEGRMVFIGVGGAIDGKVNPVLTAAQGQVVQITLINGEGAEHDLVFPDQDARSPRVTGKGASTTLAFRAAKAGDFVYFCSVPGHRLAGMEGQFLVTPQPPEQTVVEADISREPTDLPKPIGKREPQTVRVDLLSVEVEGRLAEGTTFGYWTFNGKVPGPFIRVRVGDTVDIHLKNSAESSMIHSVDFHAATGPGGGAAALQVDPGQEKSMTWKALTPGLYVYHCATPMVAEHIANGMYGLILVEPEGGLPPVDHEFYVMQGEIYTDQPFGQHGSQEFSVEKLLNEHPEYFVFNGSVGALSKLHPLEAKVGDTVRIFFGVGGPNFTSSFHVIGEIFDKVYALGGLESEPLRGIQTVTVPPGGAAITEFKLDVPGNYTLVDHALARAERGLAGILHVEGAPNPDIYNGQVMPGMGH
jgi:nitrite reductase (NO-forming)